MTHEHEPAAEPAGAATSDEQLIAMLVERARSEGMQLTGAGGLLQQLYAPNDHGCSMGPWAGLIM